MKLPAAADVNPSLTPDLNSPPSAQVARKRIGQTLRFAVLYHHAMAHSHHIKHSSGYQDRHRGRRHRARSEAHPAEKETHAKDKQEPEQEAPPPPPPAEPGPWSDWQQGENGLWFWQARLGVNGKVDILSSLDRPSAYRLN